MNDNFRCEIVTHEVCELLCKYDNKKHEKEHQHT